MCRCVRCFSLYCTFCVYNFFTVNYIHKIYTRILVDVICDVRIITVYNNIHHLYCAFTIFDKRNIYTIRKY